MRLGDIGHQTDGRIEVGSSLARGGDQSNGDGVGALLQENRRIRSVRVHKATGKRDGTVAKSGIGSRGRRGGRDGSLRKVVAEGFVSIQVHDASVLVADVQDVTRDETHVAYGERLLVQLDRVGGGREGSLGALTPAGRVVVEPVGRQFLHLVVPLLADIDRVATQVLRVLVAIQRIIAYLHDQLVVLVTKHGVKVQIRVQVPVLVAVDGDIVALSGDAQEIHRLLSRRAGVTELNVQ